MSDVDYLEHYIDAITRLDFLKNKGALTRMFVGSLALLEIGLIASCLCVTGRSGTVENIYCGSLGRP